VPVTEQRRDSAPDPSALALLEPVRAALAQAPEAQRYRLLAGLLGELADQVASKADGAERERLDALAKKVTRLGEEKASLEDTLAATKADLALRAKQLEAEQQRATELERIVTDQRTRLQTAQRQVAEYEEQLVAKNALLHEAENQAEGLAVKLQRAERAAADTSRADAMAESSRGLNVEVERLRGELEQLRKDKDAVIEGLRGELVTARAGAGGGVDTVLRELWERLARAKPPLAPGNQTPPVPAAERLVDTVIELTRFVAELDQAVAPFLGSFTKHNPTVAKPWEVYARSPDLNQVIREIIDAEHGKPAGVCKMRLLGLKRWIMAAILGGDSALESIAQELEGHLRGPVGMGSDPNRKVKDFIRDDGHQLFHQHIRELRSQKLAEAYAHGV
jgi:hypothetical protein